MMLDIGWPELMIVAVVLIVVVGPKDLPRMLRTFGKTTGKVRSMASDFRQQFDRALKEAELDEVKSVIDTTKKLDPTAEVRKQLNPLKKIGDEIKDGLSSATRPTGSSAAKDGPALAEIKPAEKAAATKKATEPAASPPPSKSASPAQKSVKSKAKSEPKPKAPAKRRPVAKGKKS